MAVQSKLRRRAPSPLARRAFLAAGLGGLAAFATEAIAAPARVLGANGDLLRVGWSHVGTARTLLRVTGSKVAAFQGRSTGGDGVIGETAAGNRSGLYGFSTHHDGFGVTGRNSVNGAVGQLGSRRAAVSGWSNHPGIYALEAVGTLRLHSSGVVVIPAGADKVVFDAPDWVNTDTVVLVTPQMDSYPFFYVTASAKGGNPPRIVIWVARTWGNTDVKVAWLAFDVAG
jgi:hypothetical protein